MCTGAVVLNVVCADVVYRALNVVCSGAGVLYVVCGDTVCSVTAILVTLYVVYRVLNVVLQQFW